MSEADEQKAVVYYLRLKNIPIVASMNGVYLKNGGRKVPELKRQGMAVGFPDLFIPVACNGYYGLFIEMKDLKGRLRDNQIEWLETLTNNGYMAVCCYGSREAIKVIENYFKEK